MGANADLTAYFKEIAENLLAIGHTSSKPRFFRTELDEFMNNYNLAADGPCLLLQSSDYTINNSDQDNPLKRMNISFIVCKHVPVADDYIARDAAFDATEEIVDEIIRKIWYDTIERSNAAFAEISLESWSVQKIENFVDYNYGQYASLTFICNHDMIPDTTKWKAGYITIDPDYVGND